MRLLIILIMILLSGCYSEKKARSDVAKADSAYPEVIAEICAEKFPVREIIIKGDTILVTDTLEIFDDRTVPGDTIIVNDTVRITKTLPGKTITVTKTITLIDTVIKENTAALKACEITRDQSIKLLRDRTDDAIKYRKQSRTRGWILLGLLLAAAVWTYFRVKSSFTKK